MENEIVAFAYNFCGNKKRRKIEKMKQNEFNATDHIFKKEDEINCEEFYLLYFEIRI